MTDRCPSQRCSTSSRRYDFSGFDVLVVDPHDYFRMLVVRMLHGFGFPDPRTTASPAMALDLMCRTRVDLLITELSLDGSVPVGLRFVRSVRRLGRIRNPEVPIIATSGYSQRRNVLAARDAGVTEFIAKPLSPDRLFHRIAMIVDHPREFVRTRSYAGPDRRRFVDYDHDGPERRRDASASGTRAKAASTSPPRETEAHA